MRLALNLGHFWLTFGRSHKEIVYPELWVGAIEVLCYHSRVRNLCFSLLALCPGVPEGVGRPRVAFFPPNYWDGCFKWYVCLWAGMRITWLERYEVWWNLCTLTALMTTQLTEETTIVSDWFIIKINQTRNMKVHAISNVTFNHTRNLTYMQSQGEFWCHCRPFLFWMCFEANNIHFIVTDIHLHLLCCIDMPLVNIAFARIVYWFRIKEWSLYRTLRYTFQQEQVFNLSNAPFDCFLHHTSIVKRKEDGCPSIIPQLLL